MNLDSRKPPVCFRYEHHLLACLQLYFFTHNFKSEAQRNRLIETVTVPIYGK